MASLASPPRLERFASVLAGEGVDAFLCSSDVTMGYLHGFHEHGYERLLVLAIHRDGRTRMVCPALSESHALRAGISDVRTWHDGEDPMACVQTLAADWNLRTGIIAVDDDMRAATLLELQKALPAALFRPGQSLLGRLMRVKDEGEIELLRKAGAIADKALAAAKKAIAPGVTELEVEAALNTEMLRLGGKPTFCIVATGRNSAEPHHATSDTRIKDGDVVLLDYGCSLEGYQSDITRVVNCGTPDPEAERVYGIVLASHHAARRAIREGVTCETIDRAARQVIADSGYGDHFIHRLGHGIGLRGHEEPFMVEGNLHPLEVGNCFSVEPGIYLPGRFGIRIENIVAATRDGHDSMNEEPADRLVPV